MTRHKEFIAQIQAAQQRKSPRPEATAAPPGMEFVLETRGRTAGPVLQSQLRSMLPVEFSLQPLFPDAYQEPQESGDLARFQLLAIPWLSFRQLETSPFDLAYWLQDQLDLSSAEPDLETEFFPERDDLAGPEAAMLGCGAGGPQPEDRGWALRRLGVPEAWALSEAQGRPDRGQGVLIGQPDTGVAGHDELRDALDLTHGFDILRGVKDPSDPLQGDPWDQPGHGTGTASVAVSRGLLVEGLPGTGAPGSITGAAPKALLAPIRCIESVIRIRQSPVARAIEHARRQGCRIITMSLGGLPSFALAAALKRAVEDNIIVLAAAGNCVRSVVWPARYRRCIAVAGTNNADRPWKGSCRGKSVDISAPGEAVWRARRHTPSDPLDTIGCGDGTSYAVALIAGVAALWLAHHGRERLVRSLAPGERLQDRFLRLLQATARQPDGWRSRKFGAGIADAAALLRADISLPAAPRPELRRGAAAERLVQELADDLEPASGSEAGPEAEQGLGLTPGELDRYGLELTWLALKARLAERKARTQLESASGAPGPKQSAELQALLARARTERLRAVVDAAEGEERRSRPGRARPPAINHKPGARP